jgi:hypothetical protein
MRTKTLILFVLAIAGYCATSRADITNAWWHDDGDGVLVCKTWTYDSVNLSSPNLTMTGDQYTVPGQSAAGHMNGWIQTDGQDPTLYLGSGVDNDTAFAWTSYQVNVYMAVPFTFVGTPGVSNPDSTWFVASTLQPSSPVVGGPYSGDYEGTLDLSGGTPVAIGDELDFNYAIHFGSSIDYTFTQEMIPMGVPEPGDLGLASGLLFGGFQLVKRLLKKT